MQGAPIANVAQLVAVDAARTRTCSFMRAQIPHRHVSARNDDVVFLLQPEADMSSCTLCMLKNLQLDSGMISGE